MTTPLKPPTPDEFMPDTTVPKDKPEVAGRTAPTDSPDEVTPDTTVPKDNE